MVQEPVGNEVIGQRYKVQPMVYEQFMEAEGIPVVRGIGVADVRELTLAPWNRMGGRGTFLQLDGIRGLSGFYVVEVPSGAALNTERHIYEELYYVVEGRGTTEVWKDGSDNKQVFEWQAGSQFIIPLNAWHRIVNAMNTSALLVGVTNAPPLMDLFNDEDFIFNNPYPFNKQYDASDDYFQNNEELTQHPETRKVLRHTNIIPDIATAELPRNNRRGPDYRSITPLMGHYTFQSFIAEYPSGRYAHAHAHSSGAVLLCVKGKGYTLTWPADAGTRPYESGNGHLVRRQEYGPGGLVSAAPGGGDWFHQHFSVGSDPLRVHAFLGPPTRPTGRLSNVVPGKDDVTLDVDVKQGGSTIEYPDEDPQIRKDLIEVLEREGVEFTMPEEVFQR